MTEQVLKIFLSSTGKDLRKFRKTVAKAIDTMGGCQCDRMENWLPQDQKSKDYCCQRVRQADLVVCLIGPCFGGNPDDDPRSFTEIEYDTAGESNIHRIVFKSDNKFLLPADAQEKSTLQKKQKKFRARIDKNLIRGIIPNDKNALATEVVKAIRAWEKEHGPKKGPNFFVPPPTATFVGRIKYLEELHQRLQESGAAGVCSLVAPAASARPNSPKCTPNNTKAITPAGFIGLASTLPKS